MGTPTKRQTEVYLEPLKLAEKISLLEWGRKTGLALASVQPAKIFEEARRIILPVVEEFAKPFGSEPGIGESVPEKFKNKRGVALYSSRVMRIWLERYGKWFLRVFAFSKHDELRHWHFTETDSEGLAQHLLNFAEKFFDDFWTDWKGDFREEGKIFRRLTIYNELVLRVLAEIHKNVVELLEAKEAKLRIMQERLDFFNEFTRSLDPLASRVESLKIPHCTIFHHGSHGTYNQTAGYLCKEAMEPFAKVIAKRHQGTSAEYEMVSHKAECRSLSSFLDDMRRVFYEIAMTEKSGYVGADRVFGSIDRRLPLSDEERKVIDELIEKITA